MLIALVLAMGALASVGMAEAASHDTQQKIRVGSDRYRDAAIEADEPIMTTKQRGDCNIVITDVFRWTDPNA